MTDKQIIFTQVYCREKKKYGIKVKGQKEWWMEPFFDVLSGPLYGNDVRSGWFKSDGKFGYVDIEEGVIVIPADYAFPIYFNSNNYAEAWQNHKTGVIDARNNVVIPIIYDELHPRYEQVEVLEEEKRLITLDDGSQKSVEPEYS